MSLVICVRGHTYHGETHITVTADQLSSDDLREFLISLSNTIDKSVAVYHASDLVGLEVCDRRLEHTKVLRFKW